MVANSVVTKQRALLLLLPYMHSPLSTILRRGPLVELYTHVIIYKDTEKVSQKIHVHILLDGKDNHPKVLQINVVPTGFHNLLQFFISQKIYEEFIYVVYL